ncbi:Radical SAM domain protein [Novosphingobium nitrogenifigens DSM 19370]|uniref:Radical SAM domain protein n=1 Tax=Novosphingobium nitrogenifigens DSM 19370 TaxID=983920 RepID=F1ZA84_9SPHN|nr:Radical SAM domain protein [Novosphingobium nitrogenifigens DSM 19370]
MRTTKGRGAVTNQASGRFALPLRTTDGDWLDQVEDLDGPTPRLRTTVTELAAHTILTRNASPDIPFDRSINAYGGCEHPRNSCVARTRR